MKKNNLDKNYFKIQHAYLIVEALSSMQDETKNNKNLFSYEWLPLRLRVCDHHLSIPLWSFDEILKLKMEDEMRLPDYEVIFLRWKRPWHKRALGLEYTQSNLN